MPKIDLRRRSAPTIGSMRDLVWICTMVERPDGDISTFVERPGVYRCHARFRPIGPTQILDYKAVFGDQDTPTTEITVRVPPDVKVDVRHLVYRLTGPAQIWYRVRSVEDLVEVHRFLVLRCSTDTLRDERSDPATQEPPPTWETPQTFQTPSSD